MIYFFLLFSWTEFLEKAVVHSALFLEVSFMDSAVGARERGVVLFSFPFGNIFNFTLIFPSLLTQPYFSSLLTPSVTSLVAQMVKHLPTMWETQIWSLGWEGSPGEGNGNPLFVWNIPWTEEPGRLQSMGSQKVFVNVDWYLHYLHHSLASDWL